MQTPIFFIGGWVKKPHPVSAMRTLAFQVEDSGGDMRKDATICNFYATGVNYSPIYGNINLKPCWESGFTRKLVFGDSGETGVRKIPFSPQGACRAFLRPRV